MVSVREKPADKNVITNCLAPECQKERKGGGEKLNAKLNTQEKPLEELPSWLQENHLVSKPLPSLVTGGVTTVAMGLKVRDVLSRMHPKGQVIAKFCD